jgi:hypothetical protein
MSTSRTPCTTRWTHPDSLAAVVEARCAGPRKKAARRSAERVATTQPVHVLRALSPEDLAQYDRPLGSGPIGTVDTRRSLDPPVIAARVRRAFDAGMTWA